jgi:S1-C subfamily serine protease/predicted esterase
MLWPSLLLALAAQQPTAEDLDALQEQAVKAAVAKVAPCVVQIETSGGTDVIGGAGGPQIRRGTGPTTGLVVDADGYVITSSFNFANRPSAIFVAVPGRPERQVAKVVATDQTRMLTLLKVEAGGLPVPTAAPKKDLRVGQAAIALGRTLGGPDTPPSVSVGIISALGRIWGKAIQTDAKVSPVNYGGPLVDLRGRVLGVLVPASPRGQDETAGVEWYDAGIGFAIPLEDVNAVLPRLKAGQNLKRGLLGVRFKSADVYGTAPEIDIITPDSPAAQAGLKPGDVIVEMNGKPVERQSQLMHALGDKYEGDVVCVKVRRGKEEIELANVKLTGDVTAHVHPFLGVLPVRDDAAPGEEVRYVFPKSPAEAAGLKAGDRIEKVGLGEGPPRPLSGAEALTELLNHLPAGAELKLEVKRKDGDKKGTLAVRLGVLTSDVPDELPEPVSRKKALEPRQAGKDGDKKGDKLEVRPAEKDVEKKEEKPEPKKEDKPKPETGLHRHTNAAGDREYWTYVPEDYDPNISYALVLWLHPRGKGGEREMEALAEAWADVCAERNVILVCPKAESETGWLASEADAVLGVAREVMDRYTIDRQRVVAHGMGLGGQFAFYLGLNARELIRGVATTGAALASAAKDNVADQRLAFFLVAGGKDPLRPAIAESRDKLQGHKFPVAYREVTDLAGQEYLDADTLDELGRWIDSLDRQ